MIAEQKEAKVRYKNQHTSKTTKEENYSNNTSNDKPHMLEKMIYKKKQHNFKLWTLVVVKSTPSFAQ